MSPAQKKVILVIARKARQRAAKLGIHRPENPADLLTLSEALCLSQVGMSPHSLPMVATEFDRLRRQVKQIDAALSLLQREVLKHG